MFSWVPFNIVWCKKETIMSINLLRQKPFVDVMKLVKKSFEEALGSTVNTHQARAAFAELVMRYLEPHRSYHTLHHIASMLEEFETVRSLASDPSSIILAVIYRYAIYETRNGSTRGVKSNEERSAELARDVLLHISCPQHFAQRVYDLILTTKHDAVIEDADAKLLLDLGLVILGSEDDMFDEFGVAIRRENIHVLYGVYVTERCRILRMFLDLERIYYTDCLHEKYGDKAIKNLKRAIAKLESSL